MATDNEPPVASVSNHSVAESSSAGSLGSLFGPATPQDETQVRRRNINPPSGIQGQVNTYFLGICINKTVILTFYLADCIYNFCGAFCLKPEVV